MSLNGQNNTQNVLAAYVNRLQELEDLAWYLLTSMSIDAAFGVILDTYGDIVGEPRQGRSDNDFRAGVRLRIRVNLSSGRAEDVIAVATLASRNSVPSYTEPPGIAVWLLDLFNLPSPPYVADKIKHTRAAGTYGLVQYTVDTYQPFLLDDENFSFTNQGLMDSTSGGVTGPAHMSAALGV